MDKPADLDVATVMSMGFPATKVRLGSHRVEGAPDCSS